MKKALRHSYRLPKAFSLLLYGLFFMNGMKAQFVTIPDTAFVTYLQQNFPACMSGNQMDTSCSAIVNATSVVCNNRNIADLTGIQYFDNLDTLNCGFNQITGLPNLTSPVRYIECRVNQLSSLPVLPSSLVYLSCYANQITGLPTLPSSLTVLQCHENQLTVLPALPPNLTDLSVGSNSITVLPTLPGNLGGLACHDNLLTSLPPLPSTLVLLNCGDNSLNSLPTLPPSLRRLFCEDNPLGSLPTPLPNLTHLYCAGTLLTALPALPSSLQELECINNQLNSLPPLPTSLRMLHCSDNLLTSLPPVPTVLHTLRANNNQLTSLPALPVSMEYVAVKNNPNLRCFPPIRRFTGTIGGIISIEGTAIICLPNAIQHPNLAFLPGIDTMPICDLFNANGCPVAWNLYGKISLDTDNNCNTTFNEPSMPGTKVFLYDKNFNLMEQTFSTETGTYSFDTKLDVYHTKADTSALPFTVGCPPNNVFRDSLHVNDSLRYLNNFGLRCSGNFDIGASYIVGNLFRPAWNTEVKISAGDMANSFGVNCAGGISGEVNITVTGPAQYISPAPGALVPDNVSGNTLTYNIADFGATNSSSAFNIIIRPDTTAQIGQQICITVSVTPTSGDNNPANNVLTQCFPVRTSYDPNDKQVYPDGDILPEQNWLTYTVRFQNTGNDTAIHVQIKDTLDNNIDVASFKLLGYSHDNVTQIKGRIVQFNFPNIMLPDSHVNEPLSHGYIQYKVKLKDNLPIGTKVENTAYIYFDFNAPVVTNTTINTITIGTGIQRSSLEIGVELYPNPANSKLFMSAIGFHPQTIAIFDIGGRKLWEEKYASVLDINSLASGTYLVQVKDEVHAVKKRFVKM